MEVFCGVFVHFAYTREPHTSGHGTPAQHVKGIAENAHMLTTISVLCQFERGKQDILHLISVLRIGTLCKQQTKLIKPNF